MPDSEAKMPASAHVKQVRQAAASCPIGTDSNPCYCVCCHYCGDLNTAVAAAQAFDSVINNQPSAQTSASPPAKRS